MYYTLSAKFPDLLLSNNCLIMSLFASVMKFCHRDSEILGFPLGMLITFSVAFKVSVMIYVSIYVCKVLLIPIANSWTKFFIPLSSFPVNDVLLL